MNCTFDSNFSDLTVLKGDKGDKGDKGETGAKGDKGDTGATGAQGPAGADGLPGADGADGVGIQSVVQTTTSAEDGGTNVITVTKTDGSTSTFEVRNGSKGNDGAPGKDGTDGAPGADGKDGADGQPGADGKSAYQYAQDGGYTGTEADFAAKLAEETPDKLPNPNALTFTGSAEASYDGSEPVTVEIPSGGGQAIDKIAIKITETVHSISLLTDITLYNRIRANIKVVGDSANAASGVLGAITPSGLLINYVLNATKTATGYLFFDLRLSEQGAESDITPSFSNQPYTAATLSHTYGLSRTRWTGALSLAPNATDWNFGAGTEIYLEAYRA